MDNLDMVAVMEKERLYPMRAVVRQTGLKPDLLRAWERRYGAIRPGRSEGSRRLYTMADIRRLTLLQRAVSAGHRIGDIAQLAESDLEMLGQAAETVPTLIDAGESAGPFLDNYVDACLSAVQKMDAAELAMNLERAAFSLGPVALIDQVVMPLLWRLGEHWEAGTLRVFHEHLASSAVRSLLGRLLLGSNSDSTAPVLLAATPARQLHELGALAVAITAASEGWRVAYLGPNLPAEEILAAARSHSARVVALSLVYPGDDPRLIDEIQMLGRHLPSGTRLLIGGRASSGYVKTVEAIGGKCLSGMKELRQELRSLRLNPV